MFERLNRCSEILFLVSVMIIPFCHFLDKEGYHISWKWYGSRFSLTCTIILIIELVELKFTTAEKKDYEKVDNNIIDQSTNNESNNNFFKNNVLSKEEFIIQIFCKLYNIIVVYLVSNFVQTVINKDFKFSNYIFDQLFVLSVIIYVFKATMIHQQISKNKIELKKSFEFAFFSFNLITNLFLILLTISDDKKEGLEEYLSYLKYRDIEDVAFFLEIFNIIISFKFLYLGMASKNNLLLFSGCFILFKILFFNGNFLLNLLTYLCVPILNGLIFFGNIKISKQGGLIANLKETFKTKKKYAMEI